MLPVELVRARRRKDGLIALFADEGKVGLSKTVIAVHRESVEKSRAELSDALSRCEELGYDYRLVRGLSAVLDPRCIFRSRSVSPPPEVRTALFTEAAALPVVKPHDRIRIVSEVAAHLGVGPGDVEESMYADLEEEARLTDFRPPTPEEHLRLYNYALTVTVLSHSVRMDIRYQGRDDRVEKIAGGLGKATVNAGKTTIIDVTLRPLRQFSLRAARVDSLLARLLGTVDWEIAADVAYPPRYREPRRFELSRRIHGGILEADAVEKEEEVVIEITPRQRKSSLGDPVVLEESAERLGLTVSEIKARIAAERTRYLDLGGVMMSRGKLGELKEALKGAPDDRLKTYQGILKAHGCRNPVPVLYALGYDVEWAQRSGDSRVFRLGGRKATD
jgi:hypothetical protein